MNDFEENARQAIERPKNVGEMSDADGVGTVGSADCGDMMRMWVKYTEKDGKKIIDRASFQAFGCQTALAVASMATELLKGKSVDEAQAMEVDDLTGDLGALPPMKIHCGEMVQDALRQALNSDNPAESSQHPKEINTNTLAADLQKKPSGTIRIVPLDE